MLKEELEEANSKLQMLIIKEEKELKQEKELVHDLIADEANINSDNEENNSLDDSDTETPQYKEPEQNGYDEDKELSFGEGGSYAGDISGGGLFPD